MNVDIASLSFERQYVVTDAVRSGVGILDEQDRSPGHRAFAPVNYTAER